jgi:serine O-acetyltransferase
MFILPFGACAQFISGQMTEVVSPTEPDWTREKKRFFEWAPSRSLLAAIRSYQRHEKRGGVHALLCQFAAVRHRFWQVVTGADIPLTCQIGGGLLLPHPNGIVIHNDCEIGVNCLIFHQVTLGGRSGAAGVPKIGGHVDVGAGAKLLGAIVVGDHARIGANAVVLSDVLPGATVVAPLAQILQAPSAVSAEQQEQPS